MVTVLAVILVLVPLAITPGALFYFDVTPKVLIAVCGAAVILPLAAQSRLAALRSSREGRWFWYLLGALAVSLVCCGAISVRPVLSFAGSGWRRYGVGEQIALLALAAAAGEAAARGHSRFLLKTMTCAGIPAAIYGIFQYLGWDPWLPRPAYHIGEGIWTIVRPPSTLGHAAYFANWLLFPVFAGVGLWMVENSRWRTLGAAAAGLESAAIVLSGTRAGILGLIAGAALLWIWRRPRISRRTAATAAAIALAGALFYWSPAGLALRSRTRWYIEDAWGGARLRLWRDSAAMATHRLAAGFGPETFSLVFPRYESKDLAQAYPDFYHESAHNIFLDAFTAQGAPGVLLLLALCAAAGAALWRERESALAAPFAAAFCSTLVAHQFSVFTVPTALYFFVMLGMMAALGGKPLPRSPRGWPVAISLMPAGIMVCFGIWLLRADRAQFEIKRLLETGNLAEAISSGTQQARHFGLLDELWYSRALLAARTRTNDLFLGMRAKQEALAAARIATVTSDEPQNAWYHLAQVYAAKNDFAGTEQSLRGAIAAAPHWFKPHWMLARMLQLAGRIPEARAEARIALDLDRKDAEVARSLANLPGAVKPR